MTAQQFRRLFQPGRIGKMELKNRLVMPPMGINDATQGGLITERTKAYYEARAKGGIALITVEATYVDPAGRAGRFQPRIDNDTCIPGLTDLVRIIHKYGAKAAIQLHHAGRAAQSSVSGYQPVAPSPIPLPAGLWTLEPGEMPRELTRQEIKGIVARYGEAAKRVKKCGFDGLQIMAGHDYLIAQFLAGHSNKRQDEYGGSLENRTRLLVEVIRAVKESAGWDFPVWCRINAREFGIEEGLTLEDGKRIARICQNAGADALNVSAFVWNPGPRTRPPMAEPSGGMLFLAQAIKQAVTIPIIAVGRITPEIGEKALEEGKADFVAIGRGLVCDPDFPNKVASGRVNEIRPCVGCLHCIHMGIKSQPLECTVNAAAGKEQEYDLKPAEKPKKVMVIGGGPAGMEAARVAMLRGHKVVLFEKNGKLGGLEELAIMPPFKDNLQYFLNYQISQLQKLNVTVHLGKEVSLKVVEEVKPDVVVLATGSTTFIPQIPGLRANKKVVSAVDVLSGKASIGDKVIVLGGDLVGCETAEWLVDKGKKVTIIEIRPEMATRLTYSLRQLILGRLADKGVTMLVSATTEEISDGRLTFRTGKGERQVIEADNVVLATGAKPNIDLLSALRGKVSEIHLVGDTVEPRGILEAVADGCRVGHLI